MNSVPEIRKISKRAKAAKRITAVGILISIAPLLTGCFGATAVPKGEQNPASTSKAEIAPIEYGEVIGSGKKVKTANGSYETIVLAKDSPIYTYEKPEGADQYFGEAGWSMKNVKDSQRVAVDYMVKEFFDSVALEKGDKGYAEWYKKDAKKYYEPKLYKTISNSDSNVVLGNFAGDNSIPNLIHDGKPRVKDLNLKATGVIPFENEVAKGIEVIVEYSANYRMTDEEAIKFTSIVSSTSKSKLISTDKLNKNLLDGKGENLYGVKGYSSVILQESDDKSMKIVSFEARTEYDTDVLLKK